MTLFLSSALRAWSHDENVDSLRIIERALIGDFLAAPELLKLASHLRPTDFKSRVLGDVYRVLLDRHEDVLPIDLVLVALDLEYRRIPVPLKDSNWPGVLAMCMDDACLDPELVAAYVRAVISASTRRRVKEFTAARQRTVA